MTKNRARGCGLGAVVTEELESSGRLPAAGRWPLVRPFGVVAAVSLLCAGCGGSFFDSEKPVPTRYVIASAPAAAAPSSSAASQADLSIGRPDVAPGLDTERIAVLRGRELDYYRSAQWSGRVVEVVQAFLVGSLQDQQLFRSVTAEQARVSGDYLLDSEVRDFQAEYSEGEAAPRAHVTIVGRIIRIADRKMIETVSATATSPAAGNRMTAVAAAFEAAAQQVGLEMSQKVAAAIAGDRDASK